MRPMDRRPILQLPASLVNRIAAGEVIERPASVVKELVENALDAEATNIQIEIEDGGRELIRVVDNGSGIPADQLKMAFAEHATSKLSCDDDLFAIQTMGFRGEALASVGAVSQAKILSRVADSAAAYEIENRGGIIGDVQAAAGNVGTMAEVRNLFFNTPARRKFLKGTATESGHVGEMVMRLALPHPKVAFRLLSGGRTTLDLPACEAGERLLAAWPGHFREQRLPIDLRDAEVRVGGVIGLPELANPTAKYQFFYLNGRSIRDRFIGHAIKEAYRGLMEPGRQPAAILMIEMPPGDVDVNVHPTKSEVRFKDSGRLHGLVLAGVREKLLGSDLTPKARPEIDDEQSRGMRERLAEFLKVADGPAAPQQVNSQGSAAMWSLQAPPVQHEVMKWTEPPRAELPPMPAPMSQPPAAPIDSGGPAAGDVRMGAKQPAMQLHNSYLVTESEDGLIIIDQHALHERIMYEELLVRMKRGPLESQHLLIPEVVRASPRQVALLEQIQPLLKKLGIEVAVFGPESVAVSAFPSFLEKLEPGVFVTELLERGEQELLDLHEEELLHELLDMMACKAAVKAGDPLSREEIEALLARREVLERGSNCPHGRPTTLRLTLGDLERQFKRKGF
jgi:DNA mismatch repair protein MutL